MLCRFFPYELALNPKIVPLASAVGFYAFSIILLASVAYACGLAFLSINRRKDRVMTDMFKAVVAITILLFFAFFWDLYHHAFSEVVRVVPEEFAFTPGVYLLMNLVFMTFGAQYLIMTPVMQLNDVSTKSYFEEFSITKREKKLCY